MDPRLQRRVQRYGWDKAAEYYEESWKDQLKPAQDKLMEMAALKPGEKVLETSCGTGLVTFRVAREIGDDGKIIATDLSEKMVEMAEQNAVKQGLSNITFRRMDAEALDLEDNQFDAALCGLGLMYFPDPVQGLKEMYRVLKPGGRSVVAIWGERNKCGWADIFPIVDKHVASEVCPMFFQQGTGKTLEYSLENAGFDNIQIERLTVKLNFKNTDHAILAAFSGGPVALAYKKFDEKTKEVVHRDYLNSISEYRNGDGYQIPGEYVVAKAVK